MAEGAGDPYVKLDENVESHMTQSLQVPPPVLYENTASGSAAPDANFLDEVVTFRPITQMAWVPFWSIFAGIFLILFFVSIGKKDAAIAVVSFLLVVYLLAIGAFLTPKRIELHADRVRIVTQLFSKAIDFEFSNVAKASVCAKNPFIYMLTFRGIPFATSPFSGVQLVRKHGVNISFSPLDREGLLYQLEMAMERYYNPSARAL